MSKELPEEFRCLVLYSALSGRKFSKSQLKVRITVAEIKRLNDETDLLSIKEKGRSVDIQANDESIRWASEHFNIALEGKNIAVRLVLDLVRAKTAAFLKAKGISFVDFVNAATIQQIEAMPTEPVTSKSSASAVETVRDAYLKLSDGAYKSRVLLKDLRKDLPFDRKAQDAAFSEMIRSGEADFYAEDDPMSRSEEDEQAAFQIGDRHRHVMYLRREPGA